MLPLLTNHKVHSLLQHTFDGRLCAAYLGAEAATLTYTKEAPAFTELMAVSQGRAFCPALPSFPIKLNSTLYAHATA